ncbi:uncharacterized protein J3D65DRAFT_615902 [Phyllosticta citribraziliensis]|uniref:F-box domain-containing protein n=1 Tax=Phyllosticta citribraziliensis TaxID=989973 RepID=A0ABR1LZK3_9PEZI
MYLYMADFDPEDAPRAYTYRWTRYCTLCMGNIAPFPERVRAVVEDTHRVSPVFKAKRLGTKLCGRVIYELPPAEVYLDCKNAFLVHESCHAIICAVVGSGRRWVPGGLLWRLGISLQPIFTSPPGRRQGMTRASFEDSLIQYCRSPSTAPDETGINRYLHHLPREVVLKVAQYTSQGYYQQCLVNKIQVKRLLDSLYSLDTSNRIEVLDFTKEIHVTRVDVGGSSYISGFYDAKVPGSEVLRSHAKQKIVFVWDDFGLLRIEPLADMSIKAMPRKLLWYQVAENAQNTTFQVVYKELMVASITDAGPSKAWCTLWDTPYPPQPTDLRFFVDRDKFPNYQSRVPMRTVDLRHNPIGLMVTFSPTHRRLNGIEAIHSMDRTPRILADAEGAPSVCNFAPLNEGESITSMWMLEKHEVWTEYGEPLIVIQTSRGRQVFLGHYVPPEDRSSYRFSPLVVAEGDAVVTSIVYRDLGHRAPSVGLPFEIAATCSSKRPERQEKHTHRILNRRPQTDPAWPDLIEPPLTSVHHSESPHTMTTASLDNVVSVETFTLCPPWQTAHVHLGALLHYADGTAAAVGECRVGQAERRVAASPPPTHVYWWESEAHYTRDAALSRTPPTGPRTRTAGGIYFTTRAAPPFPGVGWTGREMRGRRICWTCDCDGSRVWIV